MFGIPFPVNAKAASAGFVGSIVGNLVLASTPRIGDSAYSPVNSYLYLTYGSTVVVCDLSGTPSIVTTIAMATTVLQLAYLPNANKVFCLQGSHKYQLIDCANNTAASAVTMTSQMGISPTVCSSFAVDQSNDSVYLAVSFQLGVLNPSTGAITSKTGFGTPAYTLNISNPASIAFNAADGYLYVATQDANHRLQVVDPTAWNVGEVHDFGATPANITNNCRLVINRDTGHVYANETGGSNKLYVMTNSTTLVTISPSAQTGQGDYDSVLKQVFEVESGSPGFIDVYDSTDTLLTHTSIGSAVANNPLGIYCASSIGRYAIQKAASGETLQIIQR